MAIKYNDIVFAVSFISIFIFGLNLALVPSDTTFAGLLSTIIPAPRTATAAAPILNVTQLSGADKSSTNQMAVASLGTSANKTFYLFNSDSGSDEKVTHIPPDTFTPSEIVVNKGDTVNIVYYNTEPLKGDPHSFTIGAPFDVNVMVQPQQHTVIHLNANTPGAFQFYCSVHMPTMRGELVVLP
jgi:plastocyanin